MSGINQAAAELEQWITQQLNSGTSPEKLFFFLLQKGFSQDVSSSLLSGYKPTLRTAMVEQWPGKDNLPNVSWFSSPSHFFSFANIKLTETHRKFKVPGEKAQMYVLHNLLSEKICEQLIMRSKRFFTPSRVIGGQYAQEISGRTSSTALIRDIAPGVETRIKAAICELMGIDVLYCEPLQIQHYEAGQEYRIHADWFDSKHEGYAENVKDQGQRTWTCLIYLNGDFQGGETHFPDVKLKVKPETGKACVWNNLTLTGEENRKTYHAGMPVSNGNKYILTAWFRARPNV